NERVITVDDGSINGIIVGDTVDSGSKTIITGNANAGNVITVTGDTLQMPTTGSVTVDGSAPTAPVQISIAAMIYAGNQDGSHGAQGDTISGGDLGNDIFGGAGDDCLIGGANADWIFGGAGNDKIISGTASGDYLSGGAGNDSITAAAGCSAWLD